MRLLILLFSLLTFALYGQEYLDLEKNKDSELFIVKKGYGIQKRIEEIKNLEGKTVTVFRVVGKKNKIKLSYTGIVKMVDHPKFNDKSRASLITVHVKGENGMNRVYFPLTNDKGCRIYLTEKMKYQQAILR